MQWIMEKDVFVFKVINIEIIIDDNYRDDKLLYLQRQSKGVRKLGEMDNKYRTYGVT